MKVSEVAESCPTLSNPTDRSLPGSSVHGIFQARVLEWDAIAFSEIHDKVYLMTTPKTSRLCHVAKLTPLKKERNGWGYGWLLGFHGGSGGKVPVTQDTRFLSLDRGDALEKGMATHSGILAWEIPRTEEPGGLQSMGLQRIEHDWVINTINTIMV